MKKFWIILAVLCLLTTSVLGALAVSAASSTVYGDVNGDGDINNRDLALLQQYINGWDVEIDEVAADVNDDSDINNRDLALLQQYINGWDVTLGPVDPDEDENIYNDTELDWT